MKKYLENIGIAMGEQEINNSVSELIREFDKLKSTPDKVLSLDDICFSLIKHNLFNNDGRYSGKDYIDHKCNLWKKINIKDRFDISMI